MTDDYVPSTEHVTLAVLREAYPQWTWTAERSGFGWNYIGETSTRRIRLYPCGVATNRYEGDEGWTTQWYYEELVGAWTYPQPWSVFPRECNRCMSV